MPNNPEARRWASLTLTPTYAAPSMALLIFVTKSDPTQPSPASRGGSTVARLQAGLLGAIAPVFTRRFSARRARRAALRILRS